MAPQKMEDLTLVFGAMSNGRKGAEKAMPEI
jgi:hypothetical protein